MVCKKYYIETLVKELSVNTTSNTNTAYIPCAELFHKILRTHANFVSSVGLEISEEDEKTPFKHHFVAGSSKCTTEDLHVSCLLTKLLSTIKDEVRHR